MCLVSVLENWEGYILDVMGCLSLCCRGIGLVEVKFDTVLCLVVYLLTSLYYILEVDVKGVAHSAGFIESMIPC